MTSSSALAQNAGSNSIHKFPWRWVLSDIAKVSKNGMTVFSCFSCGGGSSMGYKLAGYDVIGNVEIDPRVMKVYQANNHPRFPYLMDVREFLKIPDGDLPGELFHLDILDGSPPCSVFSTAGKREKAWGKEKSFREGQVKQKLDDLFIYFIDIAKKLKPKVVIAENVSGLIKGNAKGYVNEIFRAFDEVGYDAQLFLLNAAQMGVPQARERVFFVCRRKDLNYRPIKLVFHEDVVSFGSVRHETGVKVSGQNAELLKYRRPGDKGLDDINKRLYGKQSLFSHRIIKDNCVCNTITSGGSFIRSCDGMNFCDGDFINVQSFPQDYNFCDQSVQYICGMSVPPVMMAQIASQVYEQWLKGVDSHCEAG